MGDNNRGWSSGSDYLASASRCRVATVASLVGHASLRIKVAGNTSRALTRPQLDTMSGLLDEALQEEAAGFFVTTHVRSRIRRIAGGLPRLTQQEVRRIVAYGSERHIDVIPNFDLHGHQHDLLRTEEYSALPDQPHGTEFEARNLKIMSLLTDWGEPVRGSVPESVCEHRV